MSHQLRPNHQYPANDNLEIIGGTPLFGSVRVGGAKNASYKIMIAALLADSPSRILNLPRIADVIMVQEIINDLGAKAKYRGERALYIDQANFNNYQISPKYGEKSRASTMFLPVLLHRFGEAWVPNPGGDKIGARPLERHFQGLEAMGVMIEQKNIDGCQMIHALVKNQEIGLSATHYRFTKNTHTGTETLIMAAVLAQGTTTLENSATEPEVDDLIAFLNKMGAKIRRQKTNPRTIEITGVTRLEGTDYQIMPDRNEVVSYACAAIASQGDIVVENAREENLTSFLEKLYQLGAGVEINSYGIRFFYQGSLQATDVTTAIDPGFMTDWQPLWATLVCHAEGTSLIHETIMQSRFQYVANLQQMGANIKYIDVPVANPELTYNFNLSDENLQNPQHHAIAITGPTRFHGGEFEIHDLRAGATLILAALSADTPTILHHVNQIDRGYENLPQKLISMGAKIKRI